MAAAAPTTTRRSYAARAASAQNEVARDLFMLMERKQTNLSVAADVTTASELLRIARLLGPSICILKTHIDILDDFTPKVTEELAAIAREHDFLIFEDRKFADIGSTTQRQYAGGVYKIAEWAHITNAHGVPGPDIVKAIREVGQPLHRGLLLLAEMSSEGSLATDGYTDAIVAMARRYPDFVMGFVGGRRFSDRPEDDGWVVVSPGVNLESRGDALGQNYNTPDKVIRSRGSDVIIVGRGVYLHDDPAAAAEMYRKAGWKAYEESLRAV